ncbi:MAG: hypothetical protein ACXWL5_03450 [Candidatus Chromulinivorax sp.]
MKTNKKLLLMFLYLTTFTVHVKTEYSVSSIQSLEEKIKTLEVMIFNLAENINLQRELIKLLQNQLTNQLQEDDDHELIIYHDHESEEDHRLTLRIPKSLMTKIDIKRKQRIGKISRNLWILETLDEATRN